LWKMAARFKGGADKPVGLRRGAHGAPSAATVEAGE
jgi:hypothetical protein